MTKQQAYAILGLRDGAGEDEIKAAYRALAQKAQADGNGTPSEARMNELNAAFDLLMGGIRADGNDASGANAGGAQDNRALFAEIRTMIQNGQADAALQRLNRIPGGAEIAEWNFLVGSAYYFKGWVNEALRYFETACRLDPNNREYSAALNNLRARGGGAMNGNPFYAGDNAYGSQAVTCSCCDMCAMWMCMDALCSCGRGC